MLSKPQLYDFLSHQSWLVTLKKSVDSLELRVWRLRQILKKWLSSKKNGKIPESYRFCILTVKRSAYVDLAIDQINSLHYYNHYHIFDILCDKTCGAYFKKVSYKLDYPANIRIIPFTNQIKGHWQRYKIAALLFAIERDALLIDADMRWYADPNLRLWQALLFTRAYQIKDVPLETSLVKDVFRKPTWVNFSHFATGIIYLPFALYSPAIKRDLVLFTQKMLASRFSFTNSELEKNNLKRLIDELAINFSFQAHLKPDEIATLKAHDSPGNRHILHSLYYGAMNSIVK